MFLKMMLLLKSLDSQFTFSLLRVCFSISNSTSRQIDLVCGFSRLFLSEKLFLCWLVFEGVVGITAVL